MLLWTWKSRARILSAVGWLRRARARSETLPIKGKAGLDCGRVALSDCASVQQAPSWAVPGTADDVVVISSLFEDSKNSDVKQENRQTYVAD